MIPKIKNLSVLDNYKLSIGFEDGKTAIYDVLDDINTIEAYKPLMDVDLFSKVSIDESRAGITWSDSIDLPSDILYQYAIKH